MPSGLKSRIKALSEKLVGDISNEIVVIKNKKIIREYKDRETEKLVRIIIRL